MRRVPIAIEFALKCEQARVSEVAAILSFTSEQQRTAYQASRGDPCALFGTLGQARETAAAVLHRKGMVLDSLLEDRLVMQASHDPEDRARIAQLRAGKQRLTQLLFEVPKDVSPEARQRREAERNKLANEVEELEKTLARRVAGLGRARRALSVTVEQVQRAIPKQAVLLEGLRYGHYLGTNKFEPRYGTIVLAPKGEPKWVPLGSAEAIEQNVARYQAAVRGAASRPAPATSERVAVRPGEKLDQFSIVLSALYQQLWAPIEAALPQDTKTVIISPDAALNFLSFATLLTPEDKFLSQKYTLRYVSSGRDLVREKRPAQKRGQVFLFGSPDFSGQALVPSTNTSDNLLALRQLEQRDFSNVRLPSLPGTARECALLSGRVRQWQWKEKVFLGPEATEARLDAVESPSILHLATHGFFLPDIEVKEQSPFEPLSMNRSTPSHQPSLPLGERVSEGPVRGRAVGGIKPL
ncbi:MAG TPA: CHAT domain-containing protein, partial [Candidatus Binatia bacterium]|nr:CHAT domain-containing protein [Candidatus Binatia bacterium]